MSKPAMASGPKHFFLTILFLTLVADLFVGGPAISADVAPLSEQIAAAVLAAPEGRRAAAEVLGYDQDGKVVTLREGSNDLVCLAANPESERWSVACYHKDLDPFMARGRELLAEGITGQKRNDIRFQEIEDGTLPMAREPRALYVLHGSGFDAGAGEVKDAFLRWVLYVPFATGESIGLPTAPSGGPWLMEGGTAGAHIMITPPRPKS